METVNCAPNYEGLYRWVMSVDNETRGQLLKTIDWQKIIVMAFQKGWVA